MEGQGYPLGRFEVFIKNTYLPDATTAECRERFRLEKDLRHCYN